MVLQSIWIIVRTDVRNSCRSGGALKARAHIAQVVAQLVLVPVGARAVAPVQCRDVAQQVITYALPADVDPLIAIFNSLRWSKLTPSRVVFVT